MWCLGANRANPSIGWGNFCRLENLLKKLASGAAAWSIGIVSDDETVRSNLAKKYTAKYT
jgi:hypothetical protein